MENKFVGAGIVAAIATVLKFIVNVVLNLLLRVLVNAGIGPGLLGLLSFLLGFTASVAVVFAAFFLFCKVITKNDADMMKMLIVSIGVALLCSLLGRLLGTFIPFAYLGTILLFLQPSPVRSSF